MDQMWLFNSWVALIQADLRFFCLQNKHNQHQQGNIICLGFYTMLFTGMTDSSILF